MSLDLTFSLARPLPARRSRGMLTRPELAERSGPLRGGFMLRSVRLSLVSLIILALLPFFAAAQRTPFAVGTASAAPGQKATGYLEVPAGVDAGTNIPVVVVNGAKPGPVLALVTGAHGTEYASIIAVERLIVDLDPAKISGTVILIPLV